MSSGFTHETYPAGKTVEWLTPPDLLRSLGVFDLDPCSPTNRPWDTARRHFTREDDGLSREWAGRIWLNPPYGHGVQDKWLARLAEHGDGIALIFARTETDSFHRYVWDKASAVFFLRKRVRFCDPTGKQSDKNSGSPSVLVAYGETNIKAIAESGIAGKLVKL